MATCVLTIAPPVIEAVAASAVGLSAASATGAGVASAAGVVAASAAGTGAASTAGVVAASAAGVGAGAVGLTLVLPAVLMGVGAGLIVGSIGLLVLGPPKRRTSNNQTARRTPCSSTNSPRKSESCWYEPEKDHFYVSQKARNSESIRLTANVIPGETLKTYAELNEILFNQLNENRTGSPVFRKSDSYWYEPEKDHFYVSKEARNSESIRLTANVIPGETLKTYAELNEILFNQLNENRTGSPVLRIFDSYWYEPEKDHFYVSKKARTSESIRLTANVIPGETLKTYAELNEILFNKLNENRTGSPVLRISDSYWYEPEKDHFYVSKKARTSESIRLTANVVSGEKWKTFAELKELLGNQLRDANQSKQDSYPRGECNTPEKRNEKNNNFERQQPRKSLQDQHWNVPFEFERDPNNQTGREREDSSTDQFWMSVTTPKNFTYTMVGLANNGREGFLHSLIRHGREFTGFPSNRFHRDILDVVPPSIRQLIKEIRNYSNRDRSNEIEKELLSDSYTATPEKVSRLHPENCKR
nr:protein T24E12.5 [imported] - Caenorhabditis elegans [Caenorhabditis elegans]